MLAGERGDVLDTAKPLNDSARRFEGVFLICHGAGLLRSARVNVNSWFRWG
jgi:hypothetical protein